MIYDGGSLIHKTISKHNDSESEYISLFVTADRNNDLCIVTKDEHIYGPDSCTDSHFYIGYVNGRLFEFDSVEIDYNDLSVFSNYEEELAAEEKEMSAYWGFEGRTLNKVLYSSNDMIYIVYDVKTEWTEYLLLDEQLTGIYRIVDDKLVYSGIESGGRASSLDHIRSKLDIDSYSKPFPYGN